jgi:outer membrane murein-binding lipoprotein Lpp
MRVRRVAALGALEFLRRRLVNQGRFESDPMQAFTCHEIGEIMQSKTLLGAGMVLASLLLSGCAPMTKVKDVMADKQAFMNENFSPDKLSKEVAQTVNAADQGPLGFHKMVFHLDWRVNDDDKNKTMVIQQVATYSNVGRGLVQEQMDNQRNGVPMFEMYELSYRGFIGLKYQTMNVGAAVAAFPYEIKSFQHFDPVGQPGASGGLDYQYKTGTGVQFMNFRAGRDTCKFGAEYPASKINEQLAGSARDLECVDFNSNGVKAHTVRYAYLDKYGLAVSLHTEYASGISDAKVTLVAME